MSDDHPESIRCACGEAVTTPYCPQCGAKVDDDLATLITWLRARAHKSGCEAETLVKNCDKNGLRPDHPYRRKAASCATTAAQYTRWADAVSRARVGSPDDPGLPNGAVTRISDAVAVDEFVWLITPHRENVSDTPTLYVCAPNYGGSYPLMDRAGVRDIHSALTQWLAEYRAWERGGSETP